ncbi:MAG: type I glyceraldehyde-3-phosphate dehydrogenase, partial [Chloroflexi bacterium]|nr:type I glyceraldehyde-3-phosphate dehydrogenase [Chloroflexota bacterium]
MTTRIGINGFGRIGRLVLRATNALYPGKLEIAAINDLTDAKTNAHLLKYDTTYGAYPGHVEASNGDLIVDGSRIRVFSERDPKQIP